MTRSFEATVVCPACGGASTKAHRLSAATVLRCRSCGLVHCSEKAAEDSGGNAGTSVATAQAYVDGMLNASDDLQPLYDALATGRLAEYEAKLGRPVKRLLEIGCGTARLAEGFQTGGVRYLGVDLDPDLIAAARRRGIEDTRVADFMSHPFAETFDVICASQVLEHIRRPAEFVARVATLLRPGGLLHVDVPNHLCLAGWPSRMWGSTRRRFGGIVYPHHSLAYTADSLGRLLARRYDAEVWVAQPDDATWGQAHRFAGRHRAYFALSKWLGAGSLVVAVGRVRPESQR